MIRKKTSILSYFFMVAISLPSIAGDRGRGPIFIDDADQVAQAAKYDNLAGRAMQNIKVNQNKHLDALWGCTFHYTRTQRP